MTPPEAAATRVGRPLEERSALRNRVVDFARLECDARRDDRGGAVGEKTAEDRPKGETMKRVAATLALACAVLGSICASVGTAAPRGPAGGAASGEPVVVGGAVALTGFIYQIVD